jgi:hypothetical protein
MKHNNVVDFTTDQGSYPDQAAGMLSEDLGVAIETLIQRLRDHDTIDPEPLSKNDFLSP